VEDRREQKDAEEDAVVKGKDAQGAPDVEVVDAMRLIACVPENAGDEEAERTKKILTPTPNSGISA